MKMYQPPAIKEVPKLGLPSLRKFKPLAIRLPLHQKVANLLVSGKVK